MTKLKYEDFEIVGDNSHSSFKVLSHIGNGVYRIRFQDGWITTAGSSQLRSGNMKSPYYPKNCGVGFMGEGKYTSKDIKAYNTWSNMIKRCYQKDYREYHLYGGAGVCVCEDWHNFQVFAEWYVSNVKSGFVIDKDIKGNGKIYSEEYCTALPAVINTFITSNKNKAINNNFTGVYPYTEGKFQVRCCDLTGKQNIIGVVTSELEGYNLYRDYKINLAKKLVSIYEDSLDNFTINYLNNFENHIDDLNLIGGK